MMWYINAQPTENGNYGNPTSYQSEDSIALSDVLLNLYLDTMGFAIVHVENGEVSSLELNETAFNNYVSQHQETDEDEDDTIQTPTDIDRIEAQVLYTAMMTDTVLEV